MTYRLAPEQHDQEDTIDALPRGGEAARMPLLPLVPALSETGL
ncbi:MAG: hypothetical protein WAT25_15600 [Paracoccaceae bacterium]|jgi:hypothetical protein